MTEDSGASYRLDDFNFELPERLIAQHPAVSRASSRLMVIDRHNGNRTHHRFKDLIDLLIPGDVLVFNDARVIHGRIPCRRPSGGELELMLTTRLSAQRWTALCNRLKRLSPGEILTAKRDTAVSFVVVSKEDDHVVVESSIPLDDDRLRTVGELPLPPYIRRSATPEDEERYQTVYAARDGAVAAPTAGLHFTGELIAALKARGIAIHPVTLFVSWGTFMPVRSSNLDEHRMHAERFEVPVETAAAINEARAAGRRIIAVGTTVVRVLESTLRDGITMAGAGETSIFIRPPMRLYAIDALVTNFHTPASSLLMLVASFAGYRNIMDAYREAVAMNYQFFSYGDAMLIV